MPPEQALGHIDRIDARSDVYALGASLYEVLTGRAPYMGAAQDILTQVVADAPASLDGSALPLPPELVSVCNRAMARESAARFPAAMDLADAIQDWLDGARRREQALAVVAEAAARAPERSRLRAAAAELHEAAANELALVETWRPEGDKAAGWAKQDSAIAVIREAELHEMEQEHLLRSALTHAPDLPEAHAALAARYRLEHEAAEEARLDPNRAEAWLRRHVSALPESHPDRASHLRYLRGEGALTLRTDPQGATVDIFRYVTHNRRMLPRLVDSFTGTPMETIPLPMGSYVCVIRHPGRVDVQYPVRIGRGEHWDGIPPRGAHPEPIRLPYLDELAPGDCYIPAGWTSLGGDPDATGSLPRQRVWVDAFVLRAFPVTNREYLTFLNDLAMRGRAAEALAHAPRERTGNREAQGPLVLGYEDGRFALRPDADGDMWDPDAPVVLVTWFGATAYARWFAERTGLPWRLPDDARWEKAARGVDGRYFPWGDFFDGAWACTRASHAGRPLPAAVSTFPVDASPYGVRGCAGNVRDWCDTPYSDAAPPRTPDERLPWTDTPQPGFLQVFRGGSWFGLPEIPHVADRYRGTPDSRNNQLGFRLARPCPPCP